MDARAGVVLASLPRLLRDLLRELLERDPRVRLLGEAADTRELASLLRAAPADVVLIGAPGPALPPDLLPLFHEFPHVTFLALPRGGGAAYVGALRLWMQRLDDPGPDSLVRAIVDAARGRAVFPRPLSADARVEPASEAVDVDAVDGGAVGGDAGDWDRVDLDAVDGDTADGDTADGDAADGDAVDGDALAPGADGASAGDAGSDGGGAGGAGEGSTLEVGGSRSFSGDVNPRVHSAAAAPHPTLPLRTGPGLAGAPAAPAIVPAPAPPPSMATAATDAFNQAVPRLLNQLSAAAVLPAPPSSVSVVSAAERSVGIGRFVGTPGPTEFAAEEVLGGRVEAVVRFELWSGALGTLHGETAALQARLRNERDALRALGFLRLRLADTSPAEPVGTDWRQWCLYEVLYEYEYMDADASQSLIVRILANFTGEVAEEMEIRGSLARWDEEGAPVLVVRGPAVIHAVATLAFVPGALPAGAVRLMRTFDGATGPPQPLSLAKFRTDATGARPLHRHARTNLASLAVLFGASAVAGGPVKLGDWDTDGVADAYQARRLVFTPPVELAHAGERFEVRHQFAKLSQTAVVYLRAGP